MIFYIVLAITIGCIVWAIIEDENCYSDWHLYVSVIGATIAGFASVVMMICIICASVSANGEVAKMQARREAIVSQYENNVYENDNDLGKRELIEDIQAWNEDLAYRKTVQRDFWIGIFYPNIYDQFESIELRQ